MPAPYTETQQDTYIDDLRTRVAALEATVATLEGNVTDLLARVGSLEIDNATNIANIGTLQSDAGDLDTRLTIVENISLPAIDTLQDDVSQLRVTKRQENDSDALGKPQIVLRPSVVRVQRPDGRMAQRVVKPR